MRQLMQDDSTFRSHCAIIVPRVADLLCLVRLHVEIASEDIRANDVASRADQLGVCDDPTVLGAVRLGFSIIVRTGYATDRINERGNNTSWDGVHTLGSGSDPQQ